MTPAEMEASTANGAIDKVSLTGKIILPIIAIGAIAFAGYYGLKIAAETKRNIKTLKN
jgi:hypothetical protein